MYTLVCSKGKPSRSKSLCRGDTWEHLSETLVESVYCTARGDFHMKQTWKLLVSLGSVNVGFWVSFRVLRAKSLIFEALKVSVKGALTRWQNLKKSGWLFKVRILSSWWYHNDRTFFQVHYTGIVIFFKTGPVFVGFRCCKMCFWNLEFLKRCWWHFPFKVASKVIQKNICIVAVFMIFLGVTKGFSHAWIGPCLVLNSNFPTITPVRFNVNLLPSAELSCCFGETS